MRYGRAKATRKTLKFYFLNSSERIRPPYRVICDGNFLVASVKLNIPLRDRLAKTLGDSFELFVLRSALDELRDLAEAHERKDAVEIFREARQFGLDECEIIERDAVPGSAQDGKGVDDNVTNFSELGDPARDIVRIISGGIADGKALANPGAYLVGTQDETLSGVLREMPLVPQLRFSRVVLLLEAPSAASRRFASGIERNKELSGGGLMTAQEQELISTVRRRDRNIQKEAHKKEVREDLRRHGLERRKKKAKGPNPLSCKKRKAVDASSGRITEHSEKKTRRRRKKGSGFETRNA